MEHRCSQRFKSNIPVMIYLHGIPVAIGNMTNSNRYGFFVETHHSVLALQPLEIEVMSNDRGTGSPKSAGRIKCTVVHRQTGGFGVEIHEDHVNEADTTQIRNKQPRQCRGW